MFQDRSNHYSTMASECLIDAANTNDPLAREALYARARHYQHLADELDAPMRPPAASPDQPTAQQQQQVQPRSEEDDQ
jgi:hypothetical protein